MQRGHIRNLCAAALLGSALLVFHPISAFAQETRSTPERQSILSVAPSFRPQAEIAATGPGGNNSRNTPANYHAFYAATAGEDAGVELLTLNFAGETRLTKIESKSKDFIVESGGTCREGNTYRKGESCALQVRFNPQGPGHRLGHLEISNSAEVSPLFVGLTGNGYSPVINFVPAQISTVPTTVSGVAGLIKGSNSITVDGGDIVYIADVGNNIIKQIDSSGALTTVSPVFATPQSVAVDSSGVIYSTNITGSTYYFSVYYPWGTQSAYGTTYSPGACTPSTPCTLTTVGLSQPAYLSMDPYDNLFFDERTKGAAEMPVASIAGGSGTFSLWYLKNQFTYTSGKPSTLAVDQSDNLYNFYNYSTSVCYIQEDPLYYAENTPTARRIVGGTKCGFSGDGGQARTAEISSSVGGITFDNAGNLYFSDTGNQRIRRIDKATGIIQTIAGTGTAGYSGDNGPATSATLNSPAGLAVDSNGQVYVLSNDKSGGTTQIVRKIGTSGYLSYASQAVGTSSSAQTVEVTNTGNSAMTLTRAAIGGTNAADFTIDNNTTTCPLTAGATLASGSSCRIGVIFAPAGTGARTASLVLVDNTINGLDTVLLSGAGTLSTPTLKFLSPGPGQSFASGAAITFKMSVSGAAGSPVPTGTLQFRVDSVNQGAPVALSSGVASIVLTGLKAGSHTLGAVYSGNGYYKSAGPVAVSITVKAAAVVPAKVVLARAVASAQSCAASTFSVTVSSSSEGAPTGKVELLNGSKVLVTGVLINGRVTLKASLPGASAVALHAHYIGDAHHSASNSTALKVTTSSTTPCKVK